MAIYDPENQKNFSDTGLTGILKRRFAELRNTTAKPINEIKVASAINPTKVERQLANINQPVQTSLASRRAADEMLYGPEGRTVGGNAPMLQTLSNVGNPVVNEQAGIAVTPLSKADPRIAKEMYNTNRTTGPILLTNIGPGNQGGKVLGDINTFKQNERNNILRNINSGRTGNLDVTFTDPNISTAQRREFLRESPYVKQQLDLARPTVGQWNPQTGSIDTITEPSVVEQNMLDRQLGTLGQKQAIEMADTASQINLRNAQAKAALNPKPQDNIVKIQKTDLSGNTYEAILNRDTGMLYDPMDGTTTQVQQPQNNAMNLANTIQDQDLRKQLHAKLKRLFPDRKPTNEEAYPIIQDFINNNK